MTDLSKFDPNSVSNPHNNIFGLPFTEEEAKLVILPVPWEVTVSMAPVQPVLLSMFLSCRWIFTILICRKHGNRDFL
jgi:hypothetical protein